MLGILLALLAQPVVTMTDPECPALEASLLPALPSKLGGSLTGSRGRRGELVVELRSAAGAVLGRRERMGPLSCEERVSQILLLVEAWTIDLTPLSPPPAAKPRPIRARSAPPASKFPAQGPSHAPSLRPPSSPGATAPRLEVPELRTSGAALGQDVGPALTMRMDFEPDAPLEPSRPSVEPPTPPAAGRRWGWVVVGGVAIAGGLALASVDETGGAFLPLTLVTTGAFMFVSSLVVP
jgi:hypothetical protein